MFNNSRNILIKYFLPMRPLLDGNFNKQNLICKKQNCEYWSDENFLWIMETHRHIPQVNITMLFIMRVNSRLSQTLFWMAIYPCENINLVARCSVSTLSSIDYLRIEKQDYRGNCTHVSRNYQKSRREIFNQNGFLFYKTRRSYRTYQLTFCIFTLLFVLISVYKHQLQNSFPSFFTLLSNITNEQLVLFKSCACFTVIVYLTTSKLHKVCTKCQRCLHISILYKRTSYIIKS